jgi:hypothetical protein
MTGSQSGRIDPTKPGSYPGAGTHGFPLPKHKRSQSDDRPKTAPAAMDTAADGYPVVRTASDPTGLKDKESKARPQTPPKWTPAQIATVKRILRIEAAIFLSAIPRKFIDERKTSTSAEKRSTIIPTIFIHGKHDIPSSCSLLLEEVGNHGYSVDDFACVGHYKDKDHIRSSTNKKVPIKGSNIVMSRCVAYENQLPDELTSQERKEGKETRYDVATAMRGAANTCIGKGAKQVSILFPIFSDIPEEDGQFAKNAESSTMSEWNAYYEGYIPEFCEKINYQQLIATEKYKAADTLITRLLENGDFNRRFQAFLDADAFQFLGRKERKIATKGISAPLSSPLSSPGDDGSPSTKTKTLATAKQQSLSQEILPPPPAQAHASSDTRMDVDEIHSSATSIADSERPKPKHPSPKKPAFVGSHAKMSKNFSIISVTAKALFVEVQVTAEISGDTTHEEKHKSLAVLSSAATQAVTQMVLVQGKKQASAGRTERFVARRKHKGQSFFQNGEDAVVQATDPQQAAGAGFMPRPTLARRDSTDSNG